MKWCKRLNFGFIKNYKNIFFIKKHVSIQTIRWIHYKRRSCWISLHPLKRWCHLGHQSPHPTTPSIPLRSRRWQGKCHQNCCRWKSQPLRGFGKQWNLPKTSRRNQTLQSKVLPSPFWTCKGRRIRKVLLEKGIFLFKVRPKEELASVLQNNWFWLELSLQKQKW